MLAFLELCLLLAFAILFVTQLIIPAIRGQKLFPLFRKQGKLERELDDANQAIIDHSIEAQIEETLKSIHPVKADRHVFTIDAGDITPEAVAAVKTAVETASVDPAVKPKAKRKVKAKNV